MVAGQVSLSISDTTISANEEHELPIFIEFSEEDSVFGFNTTFEFDNSHLEYVSFNTDGTISDSLLVVVNQRENEIIVSFSSVYPLRKAGKLINFVFNPESESISTFSNKGFRVNEETPEVGTAQAEINSITSPIILSVLGDTSEVRNNVFLDIEMNGLKGRKLSSFDFLIKYQNSKFEFIDFTIDQELIDNSYEIIPSIVSDSLLRIQGNTSTPISKDIGIGQIVLFVKQEGEFNIEIIESSINNGEIEISLDLKPVLSTEDKTAPDTPINVDAIFNQNSQTAVVDVSWDSVSSADLKEYIVTRELDNEESTLTIISNSFSDTLFTSGIYKYFIQSVDYSGNISTKSETVEITITSVSNEHEASLPSRSTLQQNYPNPFNPSSTIKFGIPEAAIVTLDVYNMLGQKVTTLVNERRAAGFYTISFDASNLSSGMYIYRIQAGDFVSTKKMMLIK
jgi:hypothetical protein